MYLQFRWQLESDLTEAERQMALLPNSRRNIMWKRELEARGLSWEPSQYIIGKMNEAILALRDYRAFGEALPHDGGTQDQPFGWIRMMRCILAAQNEAEADKRMRERSKNQSTTVGATAGPGPALGDNLAQIG